MSWEKLIKGNYEEYVKEETNNVRAKTRGDISFINRARNSLREEQRTR